jgi:hypothetical protein
MVKLSESTKSLNIYWEHVFWNIKEVGIRISHGLSSVTMIVIKRAWRWPRSKCYADVDVIRHSIGLNLKRRWRTGEGDQRGGWWMGANQNSSRNLAYVPKSIRNPSFLTRSRPSSYKQAIGLWNWARNWRNTRIATGLSPTRIQLSKNSSTALVAIRQTLDVHLGHMNNTPKTCGASRRSWAPLEFTSRADPNTHRGTLQHVQIEGNRRRLGCGRARERKALARL